MKAGGETAVHGMATGDLQYGVGDRNSPKDWKRAMIVPNHKKGSRKMCRNYRLISLLSIPGKVFVKILDARVRKVTEGEVMEEQAGFRAGRGCSDQIFVL